MDDYPSNNYNKVKKSPEAVEEPTEPKPELEPVIEGQVVRRKKPLLKRLKETFLGGDSESVWQYVLLDVIIPQAKEMIVDSATQGMERMVYGELRSRGGSRVGRGSSYTPYNRYAASTRKDESRSISARDRAVHNFDDVVLPTRPEAEEVIERMYDIVSKYDVVSVADLYTLLRIKPNYTDRKWGWTDLRGLGATRVKGGFLLDVPRPEPLD